nr:MAG TPA: hypothetical protein [Caudoviricetes sp.]
MLHGPPLYCVVQYFVDLLPSISLPMLSPEDTPALSVVIEAFTQAILFCSLS